MQSLHPAPSILDTLQPQISKFHATLGASHAQVPPHLENMCLELQGAGGGCVHEPQQGPHVIIPTIGQHQLLHDAQGRLPTRRVGHHVVCAPCPTTFTEHGCHSGYSESYSFSDRRNFTLTSSHTHTDYNSHITLYPFE